MVMIKKGLKKTFSGGKSEGQFPWLSMKEGEKKTIRLLTDGDDIIVWKRHYIKTDQFRGAVVCLNDPENNKFNCPLCKVASKDFEAPIGWAGEKSLAVVVDRDYNEAKLVEFTSRIKDHLVADFDRNGTITDVDYSFAKKRGKNGMTEYSIADIRSTTRPLNKEEKELAQTLNLDEVVKSFTKSKEELDIIIATIKNDAAGIGDEESIENALGQDVDLVKEKKEPLKKETVKKEVVEDDELTEADLNIL